MQTGTRKCSCCEQYVPHEQVAVDEPCTVPAGEHLHLTGSTGSECRVVMCKRCYEQEIEACPVCGDKTHCDVDCPQVDVTTLKSNV